MTVDEMALKEKIKSFKDYQKLSKKVITKEKRELVLEEKEEKKMRVLF